MFCDVDLPEYLTVSSKLLSKLSIAMVFSHLVIRHKTPKYHNCVKMGLR